MNRGEYMLSCENSDQQIEQIHAYLTRSYWATGIPLEIVRRSIEGSLCFGVFRQSEQVGFARVITDRSTFAYLCDVYVLEEHRNRGLARWLMEAIVAHPDLQGLRRVMLATRDAHSLYAKFGFSVPKKPESLMEITRPGLYIIQGRANQALEPTTPAVTIPAAQEVAPAGVVAHL